MTATRPSRSGLNGNKWRATHQATVDAILNPLGEKRSVRSRGNQFYNMDHWTGRQFLAAMSEWAQLNPGARPDWDTVANWVAKANAVPRELNYDGGRGITIGQTPDDLPRWLAMALIGGGYHEAWHTEYSCRRKLTVDEVWPHVNRLWDLIPYDPPRRQGWAGLTGPLLEWSNLIEDIRIERRGCEKYAGAEDKMIALQDLILKQEEEGIQAAEHRGLSTNKALAAVTGQFRDIGLGYKSPRQRAALARYKKDSPKAVALVMEGTLRPHLDRAIAMSADDDLGCLWLAMEVLGALSDADEGGPSSPPPQPPQPPEEGQTPGGQPPPPPEGGEGDEPPPPSGGGQQDPNQERTVYKVGDRAWLKRGPHQGREVEVVWAGVPDADGKQELKFALVEPD